MFITGLFMEILDTTVINVALPTLGRTFNASNATLEWVITGYLLSLAVWIPVSGWVGDRFGTKRTFLFAMAVFTASSALCGRAQSVEELVFFRVLQGVGGGMMTPVGTAMLFRAFPPAERAKAAAILAVPTLVAPTLGPILGGYLVDGPGWRWIFYINLPIGILGFIFAAWALREHKEERAGRFDIPGFVFSGAGLALVLYALSRGPNDGWTSTPVLISGLGGIAAFVAMVFIELRVTDPMLDLRLLRDRMFRNSTVAFFMATCGLLGVLFLLPLYLQELRGFSALESGLTTFPQALAMGISLQFTSRIYPHIGPRRMMMFGLFIASISSAMFMFVGLHTSVWLIRGIMLFRGFGMSFAIVSNQAATFATIQPKDMGRASSLFSTNRQVAGAFGVAILATVLVERMGSHLSAAAGSAGDLAAQQASLSAFHDAFFVAFVLGMIGVAFAFLVHDEDAAVTLKRRFPAKQQPPIQGAQGEAAGS